MQRERTSNQSVRSQKRIQNLISIFGTIAVILNFSAFIWYGIDFLRGNVETNLVTWVMWAIETSIGLQIYMAQSKGDWRLWGAEAASLVGVVVFLILYVGVSLHTGNMDAITAPIEPTLDFGSTGLAIIVYVIYRLTKKRFGSTPSTLLFQIPLIAAAFPLVRSAFADPSAEPLGAWAVWTATFALQTVAALLSREKLAWLSPLNYTIVHGLVALIVWHGAASH